MASPIVYNGSLAKVAFLENAITVSYKLELNSLWTASFSLPADDPKNAYCLPLYFVELFDGDTRIDLFRIIGEDLSRSDSATKVYSCEHCLATLMNDVLFQYHEVGGTGTTTDEVIDYILSKQTTALWDLVVCSYSREFQYSFENENLLSALFAVPKAFENDYVWTWDTTTSPWQINLETLSTDLVSEIRYGKNLKEVKKNRDFTTLANRIYALGYGEGINQLTIASENPGVITSDTTFASGKSYWGYTSPNYTALYPGFTASATVYIVGGDVSDYTDSTEASYTAIYEGLPYVQDSTSISAYGLCPTILVDTRFENAATLKAYAEQILSETKDPYTTYAVSAIDLHRLTGDATSKFRPGETVRIIDAEDDIAVSARIVRVDKGDIDGDPGNITVTIANKSQDIAGSIANLQSRARINETYAQGATNLLAQTLADNADATHPAKFSFYLPTETVRINKVQLTIDFEPFRSFSTAASSGGGATSSSGGGVSESYTAEGFIEEGDWQGTTDDQADHNHGINNGTYLGIVDSSNVVTGRVSFAASGGHDHTYDGHKHQVDIEISDHTHTVAAHTHDLTFGIYEGTTGSSATVKVDGNAVSISSYDDIDIVDYLDVDASGKITRGSWHTVEITPNSMSRIVASIFVQMFVASRGGGDY